MNSPLNLKKRGRKIPLSLVLSSFILTSFLLFFSSSCRLQNLERKLDPVNAEFLSKVRYIIDRKERRIFLELPDLEKERFKEEFWERRDPDPETEENEFKMEYFNRIEQADYLFRGEGRSGWLTDRGRIYVLFGPPLDRQIDHTAGGRYNRCQETWYYGMFPIVFVDFTCTGDYRLVTINLAHMHYLNLAEQGAQRTFIKEKGFFDFKWSVTKNVVTANRIEGIIVIDIPYAVIWYESKDDRLETTLDVYLELKDFESNLVWEYEEAFEVSMKEDELKDRQRKQYRIEIPFTLEKDLDRLYQGKNMLHAVLKNKTGDSEAKKVMEFRL